MTPDQLLALTNAIYPFVPDENENAAEGMYAEALDVISAALPEIYYAGLRAAWAGHDANQTIIDRLGGAGFLITESVSEAAFGVRCEFQGSCFAGLHYLDEDEVASYTNSRGDDLATLATIWAAAHLDDDPANTRPARLSRVLLSLTGEPATDNGLTHTAGPPTDRQCLGWLLTWAFSATGNPYLDYSELELAVNNVELPSWSQDEIEYALDLMTQVAAITERIRRGWQVFYQHETAVLTTLTELMTCPEKDFTANAWPI